MLYEIPIGNPDIVIGGTSSKLPNAHVVTKGKVIVKKQLKGDVTINGGNIQNIYIASYSDLDNIPTVKTKVIEKAKEKAAQQKYHVKFL